MKHWIECLEHLKVLSRKCVIPKYTLRDIWVTVNDYSENFTLSIYIFVSESLWECLGVVGAESQGGHLPELTGPCSIRQVHLEALATPIQGY